MDNAGRAFDAVIPEDAAFGCSRISIGDKTYSALKSSNGVTLIPYCLWDNRCPGNEMQTWFATDVWANGDSLFSYSHCNPQDGVDGLFSGVVPSSSNDRSLRRFTFWPHRGLAEWLQCDFRKPRKVKCVRVYWFDDIPRGGKCALPEFWRVKWRESDNAPWREIEAEYPIWRDRYCEVAFPAEVEAKAIRLEIKLKNGFSAGILSWNVL